VENVLKRMLSVVLAIVMFVSMIPIVSLPVSADDRYNATAAAEYALTYWENYNTNFSNYNSIGGDCANFVSQCLLAGGMQMNNDWYWYSYSNKSSSWTGALSIKKYLVDKLGYELISYPSANQIDIGDVLWYDEGAHVAICTEIINGIPWVCAHNKNLHTSNWKLGFSKYAVIKMNGSTPTPTYEINTNYPTPFQTYTRYGKTYEVYSSVNGSKTGGYIDSGDICTINEVYTNGWLKVTYPVSGGTRTAYSPISEFFDSSYSNIRTETVVTNSTAYRRSDLAETRGTAEVGDTCTIIGESGNYYCAICPWSNSSVASSGRLLVWISKDAFAHNHNYVWHYEGAHPHNEYMKCSCGNWYYTGERFFDESHYLSYYEAHPHYEVKVCNLCGWDAVEKTGNTYYIDSCTTCNPPHTHSYTAYYEGAHPHREYMKCSCGDFYYLDSYYYDSSCVECTSYTITYNANGGSFPHPPQIIPKKGGHLVPSTATRDNYTFLGWSTASNGEVEYYAGQYISPSSSMTLYAVWQLDESIIPHSEISYGNNKYVFYDKWLSWEAAKVFCEHQGGHLVTITSKEEHDAIKDYASKIGVVWIGASDFDQEGEWKWVTGETFDYSAWDVGEPNNDSSIEHYGQLLDSRSGHKWNDAYMSNTIQGFVCEFENAATYTISFDANGGSGAPSAQNKDYGANITLSDTVPTRSGYIFLGWATNSSATSATYQPGYSFSANAHTTLYAVWKKCIIIGTSLELNDAIGIKTYFDIEGYSADITVKAIVYNTENNTIISQETLIPEYDSNSKLYYVTTYIAPKDANKIEVKNVVIRGNLVEEYILIRLPNYIADFKEMAKTNEEFANALDVVEALETYIEYADNYFGGDKMLIRIIADPDAINAIPEPSKTGFVSGIRHISSSLVLEGKTTIRHYFEVTEADTYTFKVGGKVLEAKELGNGIIYIDIADIAAHDLDKVYTLTVNDTLSINYSALNYVKTTAFSNNDKLANLVTALYNYWYAADIYAE